MKDEERKTHARAIKDSKKGKINKYKNCGSVCVCRPTADDTERQRLVSDGAGISVVIIYNNVVKITQKKQNKNKMDSQTNAKERHTDNLKKIARRKKTHATTNNDETKKFKKNVKEIEKMSPFF